MRDKMTGKAVRVALTEWKKWLVNPRNLILFMLIAASKAIAIDPLISRGEKLGIPITIMEPVVSVGNSLITILLLPAIYIILISDYPAIEENSLQYVSRCGRKAWFFGQLISSALCTASYLLFFFTVSVLLSADGSDFVLEWSDATKKSVSLIENGEASIAYRLLPSNLYNQIQIKDALFHTFALLFLYLFLLSLVMMFFCIIGLRRYGLVTIYLIVFLGFVTINIKGLKWLFPMSNSIIWMHYEKIMRKPITPIVNSYIYFGVIIIIIAAVSRSLLKRMDFIGASEE